MRRYLTAALSVVFLAACTDEGPRSGAGTMTATLVSPHGDEGAAVVVIETGDVGAVSGVPGTEVSSFEVGGATRVVLINQAGGTLAFRVAVPDTTQPPAVTVEQVAGPDDVLRAGLGAYVVELAR